MIPAARSAAPPCCVRGDPAAAQRRTSRRDEGLPSAALTWVALLPLAWSSPRRRRSRPLAAALAAALAVGAARSRPRGPRAGRVRAQAHVGLRRGVRAVVGRRARCSRSRRAARRRGRAVARAVAAARPVRRSGPGRWRSRCSRARCCSAARRSTSGSPTCFHGARPHLAPLVVAAPQAAGAAWLAMRLAGIGRLPARARRSRAGCSRWPRRWRWWAAPRRSRRSAGPSAAWARSRACRARSCSRPSRPTRA